MLTIAEVSGLIAAAVMIVQYSFPAALVIILVKVVGSENTAATWSAINRAISTTLWPLILRADSATTRHHSRVAVVASWAMTLGAALLILAGVTAPLGLRDETVPGDSRQVQFQYARDPTPWGRITPGRPDLRFGRHCEFARRINCPGQYQGVDFVQVSPGRFESVKRDNSSTIDTTVPANYTAMFASATGGNGSTLSGMFDVQYRRWIINQDGIIDNGTSRAGGDFRYVELLIPQEDVLLKEGLIVDVRDNPGIGFRNHTVPVGLDLGGTWSEDLTWLEPVTRCADTNLTIEIQIQDDPEDFGSNSTVYLVDRGAFRDLDRTALETPPWTDNQTLDLFGRAHKAARMYNVLTAAFLNLSLPVDAAVGIIPRINVTKSSLNFSSTLFNGLSRDQIRVGTIIPLDSSFGGSTKSTVPLPADFDPGYPDGDRRLFASNMTAIGNICKGFYLIDSTSIDFRAGNITNPVVGCGLLVGTGRTPGAGDESGTSTPLDDLIRGVETKRKNLYMCATGVRAGIKTVNFRYNGTGGALSNLRVENITDKVYTDGQPMPLWAVETSGDQRMTFDPLWGMVDDRYETTDGFYTLRAEKLWLPAGVSPIATFGLPVGFDSLAAVTAPGLNVANLYDGLRDTSSMYTGELSYPLVERFGRLSRNETTAAQIPSLIVTDILASLLVGTKTAIRTAPVGYPASLAVNDPVVGLSRASVAVYRRVIRYDLHYAAPSLLMLGLLAVVVLWVATILALGPIRAVRTLREMYNQTSTGRLATALLCPGRSDPNQPSGEWVRGDGKLMLSFGRVGSRKSDYFLKLEDHDRSMPSQLEASPRHAGEEKGGMTSVTVPI